MSFITSVTSSPLGSGSSSEPAPAQTTPVTFSPTITFFLPAPTVTSKTTTSTSVTITATAVFSSNFISSNFISTTTATSQPNSAETSTAAELAISNGLTKTEIIISSILGGLTLIAIIALLIVAILFLRRKKRRESKYLEQAPTRPRSSPVYFQPPELPPVAPARSLASNPPGDEAIRQELRRPKSGPLYHRALQQQAQQDRERAQYEQARESGRPTVRVERSHHSDESEEGDAGIGVAVTGHSDREVVGSPKKQKFGNLPSEMREREGGAIPHDDFDVDAHARSIERPPRAALATGGAGERSWSASRRGWWLDQRGGSGPGQETPVESASRRASSGIWPRGAVGTYAGPWVEEEDKAVGGGG